MIICLVSGKNLSTRQNQGLNGPRTQTYGETSYFQAEPKY